MPPDSKLTNEEIADLRTWIESGAAWPAPEVPYELTEGNPHYEALKKNHWSWQPLANPTVPSVSNAEWPSGEIDRFVLAQLEQKGLAPVSDADRAALLRRVTFDLTGLPPAPKTSRRFWPISHRRLTSLLLSDCWQVQRLVNIGVATGWMWLDTVNRPDRLAICRILRRGSIATMSSMRSIKTNPTTSSFVNRSQETCCRRHQRNSARNS